MFPIYLYSFSIIILTFYYLLSKIKPNFKYINQISILILIISLINNYENLLDVEIIIYNGLFIDNNFRIIIKLFITIFIYLLTFI